MNLNTKFVNTVLAWQGEWFRKGEPEQCANFVRHMLSKVKVYPPVPEGLVSWDGLVSDSPALAASLASETIGKRIYRENIQEGDIVFFGGTYGNWGMGIITHVGIAVSKVSMIHRPTMSRPVEKVRFDEGFYGEHYHSAIRLDALQTDVEPTPNLRVVNGLQKGFKFFMKPDKVAMIIDEKSYDCDYAEITVDKNGNVKARFVDITGK